ncbi:DUF4054 domain-containing protein [Francisella marina]|uniref:DUF4054 domain-containing protein n=1 Tax=Francisella marina TaxID=2249302 RepID=A0ABX5ZHS6_9GAMM|nr:DUF4054 domain-containing protein [Francisella marina]QEO57566.1 DUF4054 domain-containing protein [Francisella marina]
MSLIVDFKARFPEFNTTDVDNILPFLIDEYRLYYDADYGVGIARDDVIIRFLLAHLLSQEIAIASGNTGADRLESSRSVGDVSVSYEPLANAMGRLFMSFPTTKYGQRFLDMINSYSGAGFFV